MSNLEGVRFIVIDTETTGIDSSKDHVVEIAITKMLGNQTKLSYDQLINPGIPIPPEVSGIHGIADWDVEGKPSLFEVWDDIMPMIEKADVLVAHNAPFDRSFLPETNKPWLDTLRFAQQIWPDAPNYKNQTLRFWKNLRMNGDAHRAGFDTMVTAKLLQLMLKDYLQRGYGDDLDTLLAWIQRPVLIRKMTFGKYYGTPMEDVPLDYMEWALRNVTNDKMTEDMRWTMESMLLKQRNPSQKDNHVKGSWVQNVTQNKSSDEKNLNQFSIET